MDASRYRQQPLILNRLRVGFLHSTGSGRSEFDSSVWGHRIVCASGSITLVTAPSGSGKTTLLRCILGQVTPDHGKVILDGQPAPPGRHPGWATLRANLISVVLQNPLLVPGLTATENLRLNPVRTSDSITLATRLGIGHRLHAPVETLSTGQRQRLALCRALARPFKVLLLDEPFSHLDPNAAAVAADCIAEVATRNEAAVVLTAVSGSSPLTADRVLRL